MVFPSSDGRVLDARNVFKERICSYCRVVVASRVEKSAASPLAVVGTARRVAPKGSGARGRIVVAGVVKKRPSANGGVGDACRVVKERSVTSGRVESAEAQI